MIFVLKNYLTIFSFLIMPFNSGNKIFAQALGDIRRQENSRVAAYNVPQNSSALHYVCQSPNHLLALENAKDLLDRTVALDLIGKRDVNGDSAIDVAALNGNVGLMDFFVRSLKAANRSAESDKLILDSTRFDPKTELSNEVIKFQNEYLQKVPPSQIVAATASSRLDGANRIK